MEEFKENKQVKVPTHVAIIMDGNGRWAKLRGKERVFGHSNGVESVRASVEAAVENGVRYLSLFAFSEENWGRPADEVNTLMGLMLTAIADEVDSLKKHLTQLLKNIKNMKKLWKIIIILVASIILIVRTYALNLMLI